MVLHACRRLVSQPADAEVPTLSGGRVRINVPEGTQTGHQFKLRGRGMPLLRSGGHFGDLFVEVRVETPVKLTNRQKELLRELEAINAQDPGHHNPKAKNWFDKVREFFAP